MKKSFRFTAPVSIAAAQPAPRFEMVAYTGGPMRLTGFHLPVVVDLATLKPPEQNRPVLRDHQIEQVVGHTTAIEVSVDSITARGIVSATGRDAAEVTSTARNGFPWKASIGADAETVDEYGAGQSVVVNGRRWTGPLLVVRGAVLKEISFVALGADSDAFVTLAARLKGKDSTMKFEEWIASLGLELGQLNDKQKGELQKVFDQLFPPQGDTPATPPDGTPPLTQAAAERARITAIEEVCRGVPGGDELRINAIAQGLSVNEVSERGLAMLRAARQSRSYISSGSSAVVTADHLAAGIMVRAGYAKAAEKHFGANVLEQSRRFHRMSLPDLCAAALRIDGREAHGREATIRAAFSTGSLPVALGSSADKILLVAYQAAPAPWRSFAAVKNTPNFREQSGLRPSFVGDLKELAPGGEIVHGSMEEATYKWQIATYAKQLRIDRQSVVNDDLGVFDEILPSFGRAAARRLNDLVAEVILTNKDRDGTTFWTTARANYQEGAGTALASASLGDAIELLRKMKDAEGTLLDLEPHALLVPHELEVTGRELLESMEVNRTADLSPTGNVHKGVAELVVEPRLSLGVTKNDGTTVSGSATGWYLFSNPSNATVVVGFLEGKDSPTIEQFGLDADPDHLGYAFRVYHDFGCALADHRAGIKSKGAA